MPKSHREVPIGLLLLAIVLIAIPVVLYSWYTVMMFSYWRTVCASGLRGIGVAHWLYAQDGDVFSKHSGVDTDNTGRMRIFHPGDRGPNPPSPTGVSSPTVDLWKLVRGNNATPLLFVSCGLSTDQADPAHDTTAYYDFLTAMHLSYAYQFQHDPNRKPLGTKSEPTFPLMADSNPYIKGGVTSDAAADRNSKWRGNSTNHRRKREGQNVLFVDLSVQFHESPDVGLPGLNLGTVPTSTGRDNIYSVHAAGAEVDPGEHGSKLNSTTCQVGDQTDSVLVP